MELANPQFIRSLYLTEDENLIKLFLEYLPTPNAKVFATNSIPEKIVELEQDTTQIVEYIIERNNHDIPSSPDATTPASLVSNDLAHRQ